MGKNTKKSQYQEYSSVVLPPPLIAEQIQQGLVWPNATQCRIAPVEPPNFHISIASHRALHPQRAEEYSNLLDVFMTTQKPIWGHLEFSRRFYGNPNQLRVGGLPYITKLYLDDDADMDLTNLWMGLTKICRANNFKTGRQDRDLHLTIGRFGTDAKHLLQEFRQANTGFKTDKFPIEISFCSHPKIDQKILGQNDYDVISRHLPGGIHLPVPVSESMPNNDL